MNKKFEKLIGSFIATTLVGMMITSSVFANNMKEDMTSGTMNKMDKTDTMNTSDMMAEATVSKDIKIMVNGTAKEIMDNNNMPQYPLVYMDKIYLPVRGISDVLDVKIEWDGNSKSVMINNMMKDDMKKDDMMKNDMMKDSMMKDDMMNMMAKVTVAKDIKIMLNNDMKIIMDENGMMIYPLIYNDRVYLPIRGISDILDMKIEWDSASKSVMIDTMMK